MNLSEMLKEDFSVSGNTDILISSIHYNSKEVKRGGLFIAVTGLNTDGHDFIEEAIKNGALAVVYEKARFKPPENKSITWIGVESSRDALAWFSNKFYGCPSKYLHLIGITGTNGKTTTSYLIGEILKSSGKKAGLIGTIKYIIDDEERKAIHTTPEALEFQGLLKEMLTKGVEYVISEVSSHALALKRVDYSEFEIAIFTNLSRDHLDFHCDMEDYFNAKKRLFTDLLKEDGVSVLNFDDQYVRRLVKEVKSRKILYSLENSDVDIFVKDYKLKLDGTEMSLLINGVEHYFRTSLLGLPNIYNSLSSIAVGLALNIPLDIIKLSLSKARAPEGRFEKIDRGQNFHIFVDYAHTPDALERLIKSVKRLKEAIGHNGRIITLFGCGGNRDRGKRPQMGKIASELSDFVILTSDNPRWEEPRQIIRDIEDGISGDNFIVVPDRKESLKIAVNMCERGDILIVAGKGHEDYQEIEGKRYPFSDREKLIEILKDMRR